MVITITLLMLEKVIFFWWGVYRLNRKLYSTEKIVVSYNISEMSQKHRYGLYQSSKILNNKIKTFIPITNLIPVSRLVTEISFVNRRFMSC